jgi:hypothetical protein
MPSSTKTCLAIAAIVLLTCLTSSSQSKPVYQTGTIMEVKLHQPASDTHSSQKQYDISVKVGAMLYTVLFTSPAGSNTVEYSAGMDRPILIEGDTMKFSDLRGNPVTMPILRRKEAVKKEKSSASK